MHKYKLVVLLSIILGSCTTFKVIEVDSSTGYFPSNMRANVIKNEKVDLDSMKALLLIPNDNFAKGQLTNIKYFDKIMNFDDLQSAIVREKLQDKIPSVSDKLGINRAYVNYRQFLWFRFQERKEGGTRYAQFILTDPKDLSDIFIAEKKLDYYWAGVSDQTTWYPLFNSLIDYIKDNSKTYRKM